MHMNGFPDEGDQYSVSKKGDRARYRTWSSEEEDCTQTAQRVVQMFWLRRVGPFASTRPPRFMLKSITHQGFTLYVKAIPTLYVKAIPTWQFYLRLTLRENRKAGGRQPHEFPTTEPALFQVRAKKNFFFWFPRFNLGSVTVAAHYPPHC